MNFLKQGDSISIRHYSGISAYGSTILGIDNDNMHVRLKKEFAVMNFLEGDPLVFGYESDGHVFIGGSNVLNIDVKKDTMIFKIDKFEAGAEKREHERIPVSIYADVQDRSKRQKFHATVKDISCYGMFIYSKANFKLNDQIEVDIHFDKSIRFFKTSVVRKIESPHYFQYGLNIVYEGSSQLGLMKEYIKRLEREQKEHIIKMKK